MYKIEFIKNFKLFDFDLSPIDHEIAGIYPIRPNFEITPKLTDEFHSDSYRDFPLIVDLNGKLWADAALYLLDPLKGIILPPSSTLSSKAYDILAFKKWLHDANIDYLNVETKHRLMLPTYRFAYFLKNSIESGDLASSTAVRRINEVCNFYRFLQITNKIPLSVLWTEEERSHSSYYNGGTYHRNYKTTDLSKSLRRTKMPDAEDNVIVDGGTLRPLRDDELSVLRKTIDEIGNIEMKLAIDIALCTGARIETAFTLRVGNFSKQSISKKRHLRVKIGGTTLVNSKKNKEVVLHIPSLLHERMMDYLRSDQRQKRLNQSKHKFSNADDEYAFLTKTGLAYVLAENCTNRDLYDNRPTGNSIRQFIRNTLRPKLISKGYIFPFKFHDLRATFGVRLIAWENARVGEGNKAFNASNHLHLLNYAKQRLGHDDLKTTLGYVTYALNDREMSMFQDGYEDHLLGGTS